MRWAGLILIAVVLLAPARSAAAAGCVGADGLRRAGELDAAKKAYIAAIAKDNRLCARQGLKKVEARQAKDETFVHKLRHRLAVAAGYAGAFTPWVLAVLLVIGVLAALATHSSRLLRRMRKVPLLGRPFQPSLTIVPFTDERSDTMAASTTAVVRASLSRLQREQMKRPDDYRLDNRDGAEGIDATVGRLGDLFPQAKGVAAVLGVITQVARSSRYKLAATVQVPQGPLHGITATIDRARGRAWTSSLWRRSDAAGAAAPVYYLSAAVAGWADFRLRQLEALPRPQVTQSATSYGHFRAAYELEQSGARAAAAAGYREALKHDRSNCAAILNLARLEARMKHTNVARRYYEFGLERLENE